jgi:ParB family chromosome partitioning protein
LGTPDRGLQETLAKRAVAEQLSVRAVEEAIRGDQPKPAAVAARPKPASATLRPPGLLELEQLLGDHLQTSVSVAMTTKHGRVVIEFADLEDLERIYRLMTEGPTEQ